MKKYICDITSVDKKAVKLVKSKMFGNDISNDLVKIFKIMNDPTRLKILYSLSLNELCVCDLSSILEINQSSVSHQLGILRLSNLVKFRKQGKIVYYSLKNKEILNLIEEAMKFENGK